ncbi:MAG TPA: DUF2085 domain-containing protein [Actinobacteria bacterium]|nr:DUF2085 domain-containing protein [Actinomycetota bacterium]
MTDFLLDIFNKIGFSVCHQIPERTISFGTKSMPVCSRCMGIYIGFMFSIIIMLIIFRKKESGFPPVYIIISSIIFIISAGIDGLFSYMGIYETNNIIRITTGYLSGMGISVICYPVFAFQYYKNPKNRQIFDSARHFTVLLFAASIFILTAILKPAFLGNFYYFLNISAIIFTFTFSNLLIVLFIPCFSKKSERLFSAYLVLSVVIGIILSFLEIYLLWLFHMFLIRKF